MLRDCDGGEIRDWPSPEVRRRLEALDRDAPVQVPLEPKAGYLHAIESEDGKSEKAGDRMAKCLGMADLTDRERKVLALIAYFDGRGGAFPSQQRIGEMAAMPRPTVNEVMQRLRAKGRLRWQRKHGNSRGSNLYTVAYGAPFQCQSNSDTGESSPVSGFHGSRCQGNPDTNPEPRRASREVSKGKQHGDLCEGEPCRFATFTEPEATCPRCGWQRPIE